MEVLVNAGKDVEKREPHLYTAGRNMDMYSHCWKKSLWMPFKKLQIELSDDQHDSLGWFLKETTNIYCSNHSSQVMESV